MNDAPDESGRPARQPAGINPSYPQALRDLEARRQAADEALLRTMIHLPHPHQAPRSDDA